MPGVPNDRPLAVEYVKLSDLRLDPNNPRTHSKKQVAQIAASMREFGMVNPVLVTEHLEVIAGHGRVLAVGVLEHEFVPVIRLYGLSTAQKKQLRIADNKIALNASWDTTLLRQEILELQALEIEIDFTVMGFEPAEIDLMLASKGEDTAEDDHLPEAPATPRAQTGDIWQLGKHRIGCGDSRDEAFVRRVVGDDAVIDAVFVDPPYNVSIQSHANVRSDHKEFAMASGEMTDSTFIRFLEVTLGVCAAVSRDGAVHFVCMDWRHMEHLLRAGEVVYDELINLCVWNKSNAGMGSPYRSKHELVFVYRAGSAQHQNNIELGKHGRNRTNVWDYSSVNVGGSRGAELKWHPTVKPAAMVAAAIQDVTRRGDLVLDTFLGSGTTLIAAERTGRVCRGVEIDPAYVDIAIERWEAITGKTAERVDSAGGYDAGQEVAA
ncbi:MAG: site-specific DNA-methyltransferase [Brevundimonas sp.]|uniref:site-specific DNA-methyltransferase n=1 Tax=Brevundimonas sp. TaxID=1871086 RepID=UPI00391C3969